MSENEGYLKEGYVVYIDEPYKNYYKIVRREAFDFETGEESPAIFSTVASGSESGFKNIDMLEPDNDPLHLFQVRWGVEHYKPVRYYLKIPTGQNRFGVDDDKEIGFLDATKSPLWAPNPVFEFFLIPDWYPAINMVNNSAVYLVPRIRFVGFKYDVEIVTATPGTIYRKIVFGGLKNSP